MARLFTDRDKEEFCRQFVVNFVSTWAANNYEDYCSRGLHAELGNPPVEDAEDLAGKAWETWGNLIGYKPIHFAPEPERESQ